MITDNKKIALEEIADPKIKNRIIELSEMSEDELNDARDNHDHKEACQTCYLLAEYEDIINH